MDQNFLEYQFFTQQFFDVKFFWTNIFFEPNCFFVKNFIGLVNNIWKLIGNTIYIIMESVCVRACVCMSVTNFFCGFQNRWEAEFWYTRCPYPIDIGNISFHDPGVSRNPQTHKTRRQPRRSASIINCRSFWSQL